MFDKLTRTLPTGEIEPLPERLNFILDLVQDKDFEQAKTELENLINDVQEALHG
jgi:hypothetical protein